MWLLNTHTITLRSFITEVPDYVILSHTWGKEEVTFDDIQQPDRCSKLEGYAKILGCCRQAVSDGFDWAWIDTCCIDKRSSAELSEAINSMYKWYWDASICYAYLQDVIDQPNPEYPSAPRLHWTVQQLLHPVIYRLDPDTFNFPKWFRRGWTLQELLAPSTVEFYTESWSFIGTKAGLLRTLRRITKIGEKYLENREEIQFASIATRLSWASERETTREEDIAYCLLGLVGINMPMLYGEGRRAFHRLQLEILRKTNDHTIFAWDLSRWGDSRPTGVLAPSPSCFGGSAGIRASRTYRPAECLSHEITNNGLRITLPTIKTGVDEIIALLYCENSEGRRLGIRLCNLENENYGRSTDSRSFEECGSQSSSMSTLYLLLDREAKYGDDAFHNKTHQNILVHVKDVQGDCGYEIADIVVDTVAGFKTIDADKYKRFEVDWHQLVCLNIATTAWRPERIAILLGFPVGGHPVFYTTGSDMDIQEIFKKGWISFFTHHIHHADKSSSDEADSDKVGTDKIGTGQAGTDRLRVVLNDWGWVTSIEIMSKMRLQHGLRVWVFSIHIFACICDRTARIDNNHPACTCAIPLFPEEQPPQLSIRGFHSRIKN